TARRILFTLAMSVLVIFLLGWWMVAKPLRKLVDKVRRVGEGDLGSPLKLESRDELGVLARGIMPCARASTTPSRAWRKRPAREQQAPARGRARAGPDLRGSPGAARCQRRRALRGDRGRPRVGVGRCRADSAGRHESGRQRRARQTRFRARADRRRAERRPG